MSFLFGRHPEDQQTRHYEASNDTILPMAQNGHLNDHNVGAFDDRSYDEDDDLSDTEESEAAELQRTDPHYAGADPQTRLWIDHIVSACYDRYQEPHVMISYVFRCFAQEYPNLECLNFDALEYIRDESQYDSRAVKHGHFKCIFYSQLVAHQDHRPDSALPVPNVPGVFFVSLQHDYVYGRVIESALLREHAGLSQVAQLLFNERRELTRPCRREHINSVKLCPEEWILYVNQTSEFYDWCCKQLKKKNRSVDHDLTPGYVNAEYLSFYLVLFLCGELLEVTTDFSESKAETLETVEFSGFRSAYYAEVNQWKKLPLWFYDLWLVGHPDENL